MRSLVCFLVTLGACVPDDVDFDHPTQPTSGRVISGTGTGDNNNNGGGTNPIDAGVGIADGGVFDAGPFLDVFDFPQDAAEPSP